MKHPFRKILMPFLVLVMLFTLTACFEPNTDDVKYVCTLPHDDSHHKNQEVIVVEKKEGSYCFLIIDPTYSSFADKDLFDQIKRLEPNKNYHIITDFQYIYLYSISPEKN